MTCMSTVTYDIERGRQRECGIHLSGTVYVQAAGMLQVIFNSASYQDLDFGEHLVAWH